MALGVEISDDEADEMLESDWPLGDDKLSGWPDWIQSVEYPNCRTCKKQMRLVFQICSDTYLPHFFGDGGIGHLTQCPDHKTQLAFGWACS